MASTDQPADHGPSDTEKYPGDCSRRITCRPSVVPNYSLTLRALAEASEPPSPTPSGSLPSPRSSSSSPRSRSRSPSNSHHSHSHPTSPLSPSAPSSTLSPSTSSSPFSRPGSSLSPSPPGSPLSDGTTPRNSVQESREISSTKPPDYDTEYNRQAQDIKATHCWWWEDIAAAMFSIVCMSMVAAVLVSAHDTSLESWPTSIQPNSIIAILTTLSKAAMLVPITSCLSQLKWRHMSTQSRPLSHLQVFDDASRGPWGSAAMMWKLPLQSRLGWALALVTVVALGIEPSAQQILAFPVQERTLKNITTKIGKADMYYSKSLFQPGEGDGQILDRSIDLPRFQASVISALAGDVFQPYFNCPSLATRCEWPDFSSLGICSAVSNVTEQTKRKCEEGDKGVSNCTYTIPLTLESREGSKNTTISMKYHEDTEHGDGSENSHVLRTSFVPGDKDVVGQFVVVRHRNDSWGDDSSEPKSPEVLVSDLRWCEKMYMEVSANPSGPDSGSVNDKLLQFASNEFEGGRWFLKFTTPDGQENYTITRDLEEYLPMYLGQVLTVELEQQMAHGVASRPDLSRALKSPGFLSTETDVEKLMTNLADTLTNQLRTNDNGDNRNATTVNGTAFINEPVIMVRWEWFILPLMEVFFTVVLLFWVIVINRDGPLLKTSIMAYLIYSLRGWREDEMSVTGRQTKEKLGRLAEVMRGRMGESGGGYAIFKQD
ncbi:hypothetical protein LCI18_001242 [Fusarium solani-melongenae]|uniref:Uncharacterized protein n=1 Tax=Fusarium solani subsp. cucurbitae TaxID=2747967 RepID=A0ACD3YMX8_FUSSC|nr:hypothetical protein LCI18_001242 [Fusarium solani-melongenae]